MHIQLTAVIDVKLNGDTSSSIEKQQTLSPWMLALLQYLFLKPLLCVLNIHLTCTCLMEEGFLNIHLD